MALKILKIFFFSLLILTDAFDLTEDEWEEFRPDVAALHRLRGLSQHLTHHRLQDSPPPSGTSEQQVQTRRDEPRADDNPVNWLTTLQRCNNFTDCATRMERINRKHLDKQQHPEDLQNSSSLQNVRQQQRLPLGK